MDFSIFFNVPSFLCSKDKGKSVSLSHRINVHVRGKLLFPQWGLNLLNFLFIFTSLIEPTHLPVIYGKMWKCDIRVDSISQKYTQLLSSMTVVCWHAILNMKHAFWFGPYIFPPVETILHGIYNINACYKMNIHKVDHQTIYCI